VEAVRLARPELDCQQDPRCRASEEWTLNRLRELLGSKEVSDAMAVFVPEEIEISLVPDESSQLCLPMPQRAKLKAIQR
jgi:hypothetical protein